jgi:hypothetical protein
MDSSAGEREWMRGYAAGRAACLAKGADAARQQRRASSSAFEAGYDWAIWDHEDANGMPHSRERGA